MNTTKQTNSMCFEKFMKDPNTGEYTDIHLGCTPPLIRFIIRNCITYRNSKLYETVFYIISPICINLNKGRNWSWVYLSNQPDNRSTKQFQKKLLSRRH